MHFAPHVLAVADCVAKRAMCQIGSTGRCERMYAFAYSGGGFLAGSVRMVKWRNNMNGDECASVIPYANTASLRVMRSVAS